MSKFYAQLNDGSSMHKDADRMEIAHESILVYRREQLIAYLDLSAVLYAHICD